MLKLISLKIITAIIFLFPNVCISQSAFWTETFGSGIPATWQNIDNSGGGSWIYSTTKPLNWDNYGGASIPPSFSGNGPAFTTKSNGFAMFDSDGHRVGGNDDGIGENTDLITPAINTLGYTSVTLEFETQYIQGKSGNSASVWVSTDGSNFTKVKDFDALGQDNPTTNPELVTIDISSLADNQTSIYIKWNYTGNFDYWWTIDDIKLKGVGSNSAPNAVNDIVVVVKNTVKNIDVQLNDSDPNNDIFQTSIVANPVNGTVSILTGDSIQYTPANNFIGNDSMVYRICDAGALCDTAKIYITVQEGLGISDRSLSGLFYVYPTLLTQNELLHVNVTANTRLIISDINGKIVFDSNIQNQENLLDITFFGNAPGLYFVRLFDSNGLAATKKIILSE